MIIIISEGFRALCYVVSVPALIPKNYFETKMAATLRATMESKNRALSAHNSCKGTM